MRLRVRWAPAALGLALALGGCGSASPPSPPAGVDGLVIPTPDPRPHDFVAGVDNPWFPLPDGGAWLYEQSVDPLGQLRCTADAGPVVDGVSTTARRCTVQPSTDHDAPRRAPRTISVDYYAQDQHGNVWWFGRAGQWEAGVDGAQAGLAMAAHPRLGDGYLLAGLDSEPRATVIYLGRDDVVAGQIYADTIAVRTMVDGEVAVERYARRTGLVQRTVFGPVGGSNAVLRLVTYDAPGA